MLYVFRVDTGLMLTFDMNLAMESVSKLKEAIAMRCSIPEDKQVMLISGGESLDPEARVCSYSAGTDTNPIFLFSLMAIESATPPSASVNYGSESDIQDQVEGSLDMPSTYETVVARAQLALQIHEVGRDVLHVCERLVHDQHLQHQGWAAAVANLEDITSAFKKRCDALWQSLQDFGQSREKYFNMLETFPKTINLLSKIPLLPCLAGESISFATFAASSSASSSPTEGAMMYEPGIFRSKSSLTLLEWISRQDSRSSVEQMIQQCQQSLDQFLPPVKETLQREMQSLLEDLSNLNMKEVKGLEDRLYGLEQLMYGTRKLVQEQKDMAQGFVKNQNRASNLRDPSILPDLCQSHRRQLLVMLRTHQKLWDSLRRCTAAKDELATNFHTRLRWIMFMEKKLTDKDNKLMIHQATLRKLKRRLSILEQMAAAPGIYASAVVEVVRRRSFSKNFLEWAGTLAEESHLIHQAELGKRQQFSSAIDQHFLKMLFPGFEDVPPPFATEAPQLFDTRLPPITADDVNYLSSQVPELSDKFRLPEGEESMERLSSANLKIGSSSALSPTQYLPSPTGPSDKALVSSKGPDQSQEEGLMQDQTPPDCPIQADPASSGAKDDMCTSDIVVLTHEMSIQAAEGATVTAFGTVQPATPPQTKEKLAGKEDPAGPSKDTDKPKSEDASPSSTKSELTQSVEVLDEEEDEFLSLQPPEQEATSVAIPHSHAVIVIEPTLKNSTSGSSAELAPPSMGSIMPALSTSPTKTERREQHKGTPDTSPSLEEVNSEGFTTADFYIDESMPSSMTESPPTKKMVAELQMVLHEKSAQLDTKERELEQHRRTLEVARQRLSTMEDNFKMLHDVTEKGRLKLKCDVLSIEKQIQRDKDEFNTFMDSVTRRLVEVIEKFETQQNEERCAVSDATKSDYEKRLAEVSEKLEVETQKLHDSQQEIDLYHKQLKDRDEKYDCLQHEMATALSDAEENCRLEVDDTKKRLILEHEVEMDRVQAELRDELEVTEEQLSQVTSAVAEKEATISALERKLKDVTEKLHSEFQEEKENLRKLLEEEHKQREAQQCEELKETLTETHKKDLETQGEEHKRILKAECDKMEANQAEKHGEQMISLRCELEQEHQEAVESLDRLHQETLQELTELNKQVDEMHEKTVAELRDEHRMEMEKQLLQHRKEINNLEAKHEQALTDLRQEQDVELADLRGEHQESFNELTTVHQGILKELREKLTLEKLQELQSLQEQMETGQPREEDTLQTVAPPDGVAQFISHKEHDQIISEMEAAFELQKSEILQKGLSEQQAQCEASGNSHLEKSEEKPDISTSISSTAEKQIAFNEALSKVVAEKDKVIEELRSREILLQRDQQQGQVMLADLLAGKMGMDQQRDVAVTLAREREEQIRSLQKKYEEELAAAKVQIQQLQEQAFMTTSVASSASVVSASSSPLKVAPHSSAPLSLSVFSQSAMGSSIMPFSESACTTSMYAGRIQELETNLKTKDDEVSKLQRKVKPHGHRSGYEVMEMSISPSSRAFIQDKVSITTCNVGDVVLLCLDERHDHYVVFNMGTTLHFLHSDCLEPLGLKASSGEPRKSWVLAEIIDKEYCQAKKAQNRFKVPLGTKFYRVKAQAWDREAALQRETVMQKEFASPSKSH